jgi:beta-xylosidase
VSGNCALPAALPEKRTVLGLAMRMEVLEQARGAGAPQPVNDGYFADPFVWRHENEYYAIGTGEREAEGHPGEKVFPLLHSKDFKTWKPAGSALLRPDTSLGSNFWAPEVAYHAGRFWLYYSVGFGDARHQMRVATSARPLGPFEDFGNPLIHLDLCPFAIDAHPFQDDDGQWYLFFARDFLDVEKGRVGTALAVAPLKTMHELDGEPRTVLRARHDWQRFQVDRPMYGGVYDWHTLEGPAVRKHDGRYYCFYSAGRWENESYGVDYAVADHVLGPYSDAGNETGARVLRTIPGVLIGPGHNSIGTGPDGEDWIVYHAWDAAMTGRRMFVDRIEWTPDGPRCRRFSRS